MEQHKNAHPCILDLPTTGESGLICLCSWSDVAWEIQEWICSQWRLYLFSGLERGSFVCSFWHESELNHAIAMQVWQAFAHYHYSLVTWKQINWLTIWKCQQKIGISTSGGGEGMQIRVICSTKHWLSDVPFSRDNARQGCCCIYRSNCLFYHEYQQKLRLSELAHLHHIRNRRLLVSNGSNTDVCMSCMFHPSICTLVTTNWCWDFSPWRWLKRGSAKEGKCMKYSHIVTWPS